MKNLSLIAIFLVSQLSSISQTLSKNDTGHFQIRDDNQFLGCELTTNDCNLIPNNLLFNNCASTNDHDPFYMQCINGWDAVSGSPQVSVFGPLLNPNTNHAEMWTNGYGRGESIAVGIKRLIPGHKYILTFYKRIYSYSTIKRLSRFDMVIMDCIDFDRIRTTDNAIPAVPRTAQTIYCGLNNTNTSFEKVSQCFTANSNYNVLWIFPNAGSDIGAQQWLEIAQPEINDVTNFSAGPDPINNPACIVTIGPSSPNCGPTGAVYTWYPPNGGTPIIAGPSQQISINTSITANLGQWTLRMSVPSRVSVNNKCSENCVIEDQVLVNACKPCSIDPTGPIDYYLFADAGALGRTLTSSLPSGNQWYYNGTAITGETSQTYKVGSGYSTIGSGSYYVINNGCTSNIVQVQFKQYGYGNFGEDYFDRLGAKVHPIQTTSYYCYNTNNNSIQQFNLGVGTNYSWNFITLPLGGTQNISLSPGSYNPNSNQAQVNIGSPASGVQNYVQGIANLNGSETIIDYTISLSHPTFIPSTQNVCQNAGQNISNWDGSSYSTIPGSSGFDWEQYDFGINGVIFSGPGAGSSSVLIAGRTTPQPMVVKFTGPSFVQKHFYYNYGGCYKEEYNVTIYSGCKSSNIENNVITLFPNPANALTTVSSSIDVMTKIEIFDLMNLYLKTISINKQKSVNINLFDLKPGIYNCRITTDKGVQNQKLVIKR